MRVDYALRQHMGWYLGDGVYGDGPEFHWDYYNSFVIQPMLVDVLAAVGDTDPAWAAMRNPVLARAQRYAVPNRVPDQERHHRQRNDCEDEIDPDQDDDDSDQRADGEDQRSHRHHDHRPDVVDVLGAATHQLAGLGAIVERELHRLQMSEDFVAHVVGDPLSKRL